MQIKIKAEPLKNMSIMKVHIYKLTWGILLLGIIATLIPACKDDFSGLRYDSEDKMQIYDYLKTRSDLSVYKEISDYSGFYGVLSTAGAYTAFIPTNTAFETLFKQLNVSKISDKTPEYWLKYLQYMTVNAKLNTNSFEVGILDDPTLMGEDFYLVADIREGYNAVKLNGVAKVQEANINVANGYVNVLDAVLLPPTSNIYDMLVNTGVYKTMLQIFEDNGLTSFLKDSTITLIIEPDYVLEKYNFDRKKLPNEADWINYHIIYNERSFSDALNGRTIAPMYNQEYLTFNIDAEDKLWVNQIFGFSQSAVNGINKVASNGIYHTLDTVLAIVEATPGKMTHNLVGKTDEAAGVVQNVFADAPAIINEDTGTSSFHRDKKPPICGFDCQQVGDIFYTTIPDVVKGKYAVNMVYRTGNRSDFMMIYNDEVVGSDLVMDTPDGSWPTWTYMSQKKMGEIEVAERGPVKLYFQVIKMKRAPAACCDLLMDAIELIPVEE